MCVFQSHSSEAHLISTSPNLLHLSYVSAGSTITDTYTGSSYLDGDPATVDSYFSQHHKYALLWEPGEYVRWYLDDKLLFEVDKTALRKQVGDGVAWSFWRVCHTTLVRLGCWRPHWRLKGGWLVEQLAAMCSTSPTCRMLAHKRCNTRHSVLL